MISKMHRRIKNTILAFGMLLPLALASTLCAAADTPPAATSTAAPAEPLQELKQVFVYGKKLATEIADTEDNLYSLYNRLNRDHDYDIVCGIMSIDRGSLITKRVCVPGFIADRVNEGATFAGISYSHSDAPGCSQSMVAQTDNDGNVFYQANCVPVGGTGYSLNGGGYAYTPNYAGSVAYVDTMRGDAILAQPISAQRRQAYADNVMKVIHSDIRLMKVATHLAGLYNEFQVVQTDYAQRKAEERAARVPAKPNLGPRVL